MSVELAENGVLDKYEVELIGAKLPAIQKAEDRALFKEAMIKIGLDVPESGIAHSVQEALDLVKGIGFPQSFAPRLRSAARAVGLLTISKNTKKWSPPVSR